MSNGNSNGNNKRIKLSNGNGTDNNYEYRSTIDNNDDNVSEYYRMLDDSEDEIQISQSLTQLDQMTTNGATVTALTHNNEHKAVQLSDTRVSDVPMTSDNSSDDDRDAIMGKIKILEANKNRAEKELKEYKIRYLLLEKSKQELEEDFKRRMSDHESHTKSIDGFRLNDIKQYELYITELEDRIRKLSGSDGRNAPHVVFGTDLHKQRMQTPSFANEKLKEFYSPLPTQNMASKSQKLLNVLLAPPTQQSSFGSSNLLVSETQISKSSSSSSYDVFKSPLPPKSKGRFNNPLPFSPQEIPCTQFSSFNNECSVVPQTQQMSQQSNDEAMAVDSSDQNSQQTMSQLNNTQKHKEINGQLINNWKSMQHLINRFRIVDQFDTNWIRDTEQTLAWCKSFVEINSNVANL